MTSNHNASSSEDVENQDQSQLAQDDVTAFQKNQDRANSMFGQVLLALAVGGTSYAVESVKAYKTLKGPLDPKKLMEDPKYRRQIERAVQLAKRHDKWLKIKSDKEIIHKTETALSQVKATHAKLRDFKTPYAKEFYHKPLQESYRLSDKEMERVVKAAGKKIKDNPCLSMQHALQEEAQRITWSKKREEVIKEAKASGETLKRDQIEERIRSKFRAEEETKFDIATGLQTQHEDDRTDQLIQDGTKQVAETLKTEAKPATQPLSAATPAPTAPPPAAAPVIKGPSPVPAKTPAVALHPPVPSTLTPGLSKLTSSINQGFSPITSRIRSLSNGLKNGLGGLGNMLKGLVGSLIKGLSRLNPAGLAASLALRYAPIIIVIIISLAVGLPLLLAYSSSQMNPFSYLTSKNPLVLKASVLESKTYSWSEFEKKFLSLSNNKKTISWQQFEKENIIPAEKYLSQNQE